MLIIKPVIICIVTLIIILLLKNTLPEFVPLLLIISGIIVLSYTFPLLKNIFDSVIYFKDIAPGLNSVIKMIIKIVAVAIICEFTSQLCSDSGEAYLSSKINFVGKTVILSLILPNIIHFIETISNLLGI